jgi:lipid II isoglutaminyl synthase (glutamine-hydrolysing)
MNERLRIAHLYPDHMNIYGDRGNILAFQQRCRWRGVGCEVVPIRAGDTVDWASFDLAFFGGGQDSGQSLIARDLRERQASGLIAAAEDGLVMLTICGGYQLLGHSFLTHEGENIPGIGLLDIHTRGGTKRMIGNVVVDAQLDSGDGPRELRLVGFENHSGRTYLGAGVRPLGCVRLGAGNNGEDGSEGAVYRNVYGCYLHGSLLPKNPAFADHLLLLALRRRYGQAATLAPLDDRIEHVAHQAMLARLVG